MKRLEKPNWQKQQERKKRLWLMGLALSLLIPFGVGSAYVLNKNPAISSAVFGDSNPEIQGNKIFVRRGDDFQAALNRAQPGDTILLQAGETFKGAFRLPKKGGNRFITIRSSAPDSRLPAKDKRLDPQKYAAVLPKLESNVRGNPVILAEKGAHHYRFIGVEFMPTIEGLYNIIRIGTNDETRVEDLPHHIEFDRVYVHGSEKYGQRRGIAANGRHIRIINSYFSNIKREGDESQAIAAWATDGPIEIINNYLEAAAQGVLFGGAGSPLKLTPTNCIVRDNHFHKPLEWKGKGWIVKNIFEIKNGKNIRVHNNLMTNNWASGQDGTAILFTTRADNDNVVIEDIEFYDNIIRGSGNAVNILGNEGNGGKNLTIRNNIFADIDKSKWGGGGHFLIGTTWSGLVIENNTIIQNGNITNAYGDPITGFVFRNNIIHQNDYGFFGDNMGSGKRAINRYFPRAVIQKNVILGGSFSDYGRSNYYPASVRQMGFLDTKNYVLPKDNPYKTKGVGGKQIGASVRLAEVGGN